MALVGDKPGRLLGWALRLPTFCYRRNLGWIFGHRFLMLTHRGRRSGCLHHTVLEVLRFDPATHESIVAAAWGERADWLRNIRASPAVEVRTGRNRYTPTQHILTAEEAREMYTAWSRQHPIEAHLFQRALGISASDPEDARCQLLERVRFVAFRPAADR